MSKGRSNVWKLRSIVDVTDPVYGAKADGATNDVVAIHIARDALTAGGLIYLPPGNYYLGTAATALIFSGTTSKQFKLRGAGSGVTKLVYSGTGDGLKIDDSAGTSILQSIEGMTIDLSGAGAAANALHNDGVWRSYIDDVRLIGPAGSTGAGILCDDATNGTFDLKSSRLYISGFGRGIKAHGGATNKVTNFTVNGAYVSSCTVNFDFKNAIDVFCLGCQSETSTSDGIQTDTVDNFTWIGGAIEGSGGYGINCVGLTRGLNIIAGMFNNTSGNFGGTYQQLRHFGEQVLDIFEDALVRMRGVAAGTKAYLSFFENGLCDTRLARSGSGNSIGIFDGLSSNTERMRIDSSNAIYDILTSTGRFRAQAGAYFEFLIGGVSTKIRAGTNTPEGNVVGVPGDIFLRTNGGAATSLYVKETGTGNVGWVGK